MALKQRENASIRCRCFCRKSERLLALLVLVAGLSSCSLKGFVWIIPNSSVSNLSFGIGDHLGDHTPRVLYGFSVARCAEGHKEGVVMWWTEANMPSDTETKVSVVKYGIVPHGFYSLNAAKPLEPGCYKAHMDGKGSGSTTFIVNKDGTVVESRD